MKSVFLLVFLLFFVISPVFGQLSDRTGLVNRLDVEAGGHIFEVETVSNFDVIDHQFEKNEKRLTIFIESGLENNLGEVIIPKELLTGNFTFYLNDQLYEPKFRSNDKITFVTLNFTGMGNNKIDIVGTETLIGVEEKPLSEKNPDSLNSDNGGGCLIATATYGTELAPQVQQLREIRDQKLMKSDIGRNFMILFNEVYYSFSPHIADYERENPFFKETVKLFLTPMISSLSILNYFQMDNDLEILGSGIGIITLNIGMYLGIPAILLRGLRR